MSKRTPGEQYKSAIYHMIYYNNILSNPFNSFVELSDTTPKETTDPIYVGIYSNAILTVYCFLEEYDNFFTSTDPNTKRKIQEFKKIMKPATDELRKWKDLTKFRNEVIAHNLRIKDAGYTSVFLNGKLSKYQIPLSISDLVIIVECVKAIAIALKQKFKNEYMEFSKEVNSCKREISNPNLSGSEMEKYLADIKERIKANVESLVSPAH